jgi:hypothetical protein
LRKAITYFALSLVCFLNPSLPSSGETVEGTQEADTTLVNSITPQFKEVVEKGCLSCHEGIEDISPVMTEAGVNCVY